MVKVYDKSRPKVRGESSETIDTMKRILCFLITEIITIRRYGWEMEKFERILDRPGQLGLDRYGRI